MAEEREQRFRRRADPRTMPKSRRSTRRAQLFSLSRMTRTAQPPPGHVQDDDGCPICVALRSGAPIASAFPDAGGGPPPVDLRVLTNAAQKALPKNKPSADKTVEF